MNHEQNEIEETLKDLATLEPSMSSVDAAMAKARQAIAIEPKVTKLNRRSESSLTRSRLFRGFAALAPMILVAVFVVKMFSGDPALAEVREALGKTRYISYLVEVLSTPAALAEEEFSAGQKVMVDLGQNRFRTEAINGSQVVVVDQQRSMFLDPKRNFASFIEHDGMGSEISIFVDALAKIREGGGGGVVRLDDIELDGNSVHAFDLSKLTPFQETILYVEPASKLPVKLETKGAKGTDLEGFHAVATGFSYKAIEDDLFSTKAPAGYSFDDPSIPTPAQ